MQAKVYREFERICRARHRGDSVLEVGAVPSGESLLCMPALKSARNKIGISLEGPFAGDGFEILKGDANDMAMFADGAFDTVLANSVLEHDRFFWKTLAEMKRVLRPGGLLAVGVPGFAVLGADRLLSGIARLNLLRRLGGGRSDEIAAATLTLKLHNCPADYYRFSPAAVREVFLAGLEQADSVQIMIPPRIIGWGNKPDGSSDRRRDI